MAHIETRGDTVFVPLPPRLHAAIAGGCQCPYCKRHPERTPMWDTLATAEGCAPWVVHYPELAGREPSGEGAPMAYSQQKETKAMSLEQALEIVRAAGYRASLPKAKLSPAQRGMLNAISRSSPTATPLTSTALTRP